MSHPKQELNVLLLDDFMGWLIKLVVGGVAGFLWWLRKRDKQQLDDHSEQITHLRAVSVSEDKVRQIVIESINGAINPLVREVGEIKVLVEGGNRRVEELRLKIANQEGYQQAVKEMQART